MLFQEHADDRSLSTLGSVNLVDDPGPSPAPISNAELWKYVISKVPGGPYLRVALEATVRMHVRLSLR